MLCDQDYLRYGRHILLDEVGEQGQHHLLNSHVAVVGVGGLGCPAALYLAASGIGTLTLIDHDKVELSNLQRQTLFHSDDIQQSKVQVAARELKARNPALQVHAEVRCLQEHNLDTLLGRADLVLDCSDNMPTRQLVNGYCKSQQIPLVSGAAAEFGGQVLGLSMQAEQPCYQCLYPEASGALSNCRQAGVIAPLVGIIGSMQALLAVKFLSRKMSSDWHQLHVFDGRQMQWQRITLNPDPQCAVCLGKQQEKRHESVC